MNEEGGDQALARLAFVPVAIGLEDGEELFEPGLGLAIDQQSHTEQIARREVGGIPGDARFEFGTAVLL